MTSYLRVPSISSQLWSAQVWARLVTLVIMVTMPAAHVTSVIPPHTAHWRPGPKLHWPHWCLTSTVTWSSLAPQVSYKLLIVITPCDIILLFFACLSCVLAAIAAEYLLWLLHIISLFEFNYEFNQSCSCLIPGELIANRIMMEHGTAHRIIIFSLSC